MNENVGGWHFVGRGSDDDDGLATEGQDRGSEHRRCRGRSGSPRGVEQGGEAEESRAPPTKGPCEHGVKKRSKCKVCSGCPHGRLRHRCRECGGSSFCEHGRERNQCKECGGASICEHGRERSQCKECGGGAICEHGRQRSQCKECGGSQICEHGRQRCRCKECKK